MSRGKDEAWSKKETDFFLVGISARLRIFRVKINRDIEMIRFIDEKSWK